MSSGSSSGGPVRILADTSSSGSAMTRVAASSLSLGPRATAVRPGATCSTMRSRARRLRSGSVTSRGDAEHDHRPVVHRVVERRARQHQPVEQGHGDAHRPGQGAQQAAGLGAVEHQLVVEPGVDGRDDVGLAVGHEADVAHRGLVQDGGDHLAVVGAAGGQAVQPGARRGREALVHGQQRAAPLAYRIEPDLLFSMYHLAGRRVRHRLPGARTAVPAHRPRGGPGRDARPPAPGSAPARHPLARAVAGRPSQHGGGRLRRAGRRGLGRGARRRRHLRVARAARAQRRARSRAGRRAPACRPRSGSTWPRRPAPALDVPAGVEPPLALWGGVPDLRLVPHGALARAYRRAMRQAGSRLLAYADPGGLPQLRAAIASRVSRERGIAAGPGGRPRSRAAARCRSTWSRARSSARGRPSRSRSWATGRRGARSSGPARCWRRCGSTAAGSTPASWPACARAAPCARCT